jgi:hypothetical protein
MADELAEAEKKTMADSETARKSRQRCEARAFRTLQPILNAVVRQSGQVETELADFLKTSPKLARYLARWQAEESRQPLPTQLAPVESRGFSLPRRW